MIRALLASFAFLTRFPVPIADINQHDLGARWRSSRWLVWCWGW